MITFTKTLPPNNNVKGSGVGSPPVDMNKISDALVEIRSSVPSTPTDIGSVTSSQLTTLSTRVSNLVTRINALKVPAIADSFGRTTLGSNYILPQGSEHVVINNNQLSAPGAPAMVIAARTTRTYNMYARMTVAVVPVTDHPAIYINYSTNSYYKAFYNVTNGRWQVSEYAAGTTTVLGTLAAAIPTAPYSIMLTQFQNSIALSVNDVAKITVLDSTPLTGKNAAMSFSYATTADNVQRLDDLIYGDL